MIYLSLLDRKQPYYKLLSKIRYVAVKTCIFMIHLIKVVHLFTMFRIAFLRVGFEDISPS